MIEQTRFHGVNLTGWLTLESWVTPELFADSGTLSEPELARALGTERYRARVQAHRSTFITEDDFRLIAERGFNAVRLPVPWYVFGDEGPLPGPYVGCLQEVEQALEWAASHKLAVLLVLAISPGSAEYSSQTIPSISLVQRRRNELISVVSSLVYRFRDASSLLGIELADDPVPQRRKGLQLTDGIPLHRLRNYYRIAYEAVRREGGDDILVVLPDAGLPASWDLFLAGSRDTRVWLDCHLYQYLDDLSGPARPIDARSLVRKSKRSLDRARRSKLPVMVGKWSAALPYSDSASTPEGRIALERVYVSEQLAAYRECPAWFFQTWKTSTRLPNWDARIALSSFERRLLD